ncbi:hypothetical protein JCM15765_42990 [Paradesulfitobacterium aromaticivorans]
MIFTWLMGLIAILALVAAASGDYWCGKNKHSVYYQTVQKPLGKQDKAVEIPMFSEHDAFYSKLNSL